MTLPSSQKVLVLGYGNPAREDDGLGPAAAAAIEKLDIEGITVDSDYQLTVEASVAVAEHDVVIFIDASIEGEKPFYFSRAAAKSMDGFSTHHIEPEGVMGLAKDLFNAGPEAYILGIRGYSFSMFKETMTKKALGNLKKALRFLEPLLQSGSFHNAEQ